MYFVFSRGRREGIIRGAWEEDGVLRNTEVLKRSLMEYASTTHNPSAISHKNVTWYGMYRSRQKEASLPIIQKE